MKSTPDDPPDFVDRLLQESGTALHWPILPSLLPLQRPMIALELEHDFSLLDDWRAPFPEENEMLLAHGDRVYQHAGRFP